MIVNKIISGFVVQTYDTDLKRFTEQHLVSEDGATWEDGYGEEIESPLLDNGEEPILNMELVQPVEPATPTPLVAKATNFSIGETVEVLVDQDQYDRSALDETSDSIKNPFIGTVVAIKPISNLVVVKDDLGITYDIEPENVLHIK